MAVHLDMLVSDYCIFGLVLIVLILALWSYRHPQWRAPWRQVMCRAMSAGAVIVLLFYVTVGLLDSIHFQISDSRHQQQLYSVLDLLMDPLAERSEQTYAAPFANHLFTKSIIEMPSGAQIRSYALLRYTHGNIQDILLRIGAGVLAAVISFLVIFGVFFAIYGTAMLGVDTPIAWRVIWITFLSAWILVWVCVMLAGHYHILGTDKVGRDVFYQTIKSIRTGLVLGTLTTLFALPFALLLGMLAGYFRGWIDDIIQYLYTTLSSIPGVLLISASVLMLQVYMANHANSYPSLMRRADVRLLALCFILGITGWASLCRFLRGETLKLRDLEFVQAARALGVRQFSIILRHIMPNVFHIVIITLVLDFSGLVLAEAVLSYIGVGVDPTTISWGNMINSSRLELARDPVVWWPLVAALIFMFGLVLAANIFADSVRDAFDPQLKV